MTMRNNWIALVTLLFTLASTKHGVAADMCQKGATVKFSCHLKESKKIVSLCQIKGKITYNFGAPGKIELSLDDQNNIELHRTTYATGETLGVRFKSGKYSYELQNIFGSKPPEDLEMLRVIKDGDDIFTKDCDYSKPTVSEVRFVFGELEKLGFVINEN
jgi:hypothetical protein